MEQLPAEVTAAELASILRRNDNHSCVFLSQWYSGMAAWTSDECAAVVSAARQNRSVRFVVIDINQLSPMLAAGIVSNIISGFRRIRLVAVVNTGATCNPPVVDALLDVILDMKECGPAPVAAVRLGACSSPGAFLDFINRFPDLAELGVDGRCPCQNGPCGRHDDFSWTVATSVGRLPSIRRFRLERVSTMIPSVRVLNAVKESTTIDSLGISVTTASKSFLREISAFCGGRTSISKLRISGEVGEILDVSPLFDLPITGFAFSDSIQAVDFFECKLRRVHMESAAAALKHVSRIRFGRCHFPAAFDLCLRLPRLTSIACTARSAVVTPRPGLAGDFDGRPYTLETNENLVQLCRVIERDESLVRSLEIDLVCREPTLEVRPHQSFPAVGRLLRHSRGELAVHFGNHTFHVCDLIVSALTRLRPDLRELRLHFFRCSLADNHYAELLRAVHRNKTLTLMEIGFDTEPATGTQGLVELDLSMDAIESLVRANDTLETLSLHGLQLNHAFDVLQLVIPVLADTNRSLRRLELHHVDLADRKSEIIRLLLPMLQTNHVFSCLHDLDITSDDGPEAARVAHLLKQNQYGRRLLHKNPDLVPFGIWPTILAKISKDKEHKLMYSFLRARPDIVRLPHLCAE